MSVSQNVAVRFYCEKANAAKIIKFLEDYLSLMSRFELSDEKVYVGTLPCRAPYVSEEADFVSFDFNSCQAWNWDFSVKFFTPFIESGLCYKIFVSVFQDNGSHIIYKNTGAGLNDWHKYEFECESLGLYEWDFYSWADTEGIDYDSDEAEAEARKRFEEEWPQGTFDEYLNRIYKNPDEFDFEMIWK